jgi:hypothetical protein
VTPACAWGRAWALIGIGFRRSLALVALRLSDSVRHPAPPVWGVTAVEYSNVGIFALQLHQPSDARRASSQEGDGTCDRCRRRGA